jgi:signal transduction histidine kinase/CheY-like chemotaxis protein
MAPSTDETQSDSPPAASTIAVGPLGHSPAQARRRVAAVPVVVVLLVAVLPFAHRAEYRGTPEFHATLETTGAFLALLAGTCFIARFYSLGNRFLLLVGLAFFVNGAKDLVHGLLALADSRGWLNIPDPHFEQAVPATGVSGRVLMALLLVLAVLLPQHMPRPRSPKRETILVSLAVLLATGLATAVMFMVSLPPFRHPEWTLSRPVDFASAVLFAVALWLFLKMYYRTRHPLTWWLALSIGVSVAGQVIMGFSEYLGDLCYDLAHVYKVAGYAIPLLGFALFQISTIVEMRRMGEMLELRVRERTADLEQARQAAEAASRAKSTFLANMSHEIRTPLNAVIGMTELVLKGNLSPQQREQLLTVKDSGEALLSVINDILDFSKIEAGKLALDRTVFDLWESLGDTMKSFALRAHQRGLELTCFIHPDVPRLVSGDYNRLRQVVVNLVGNALKFTDQGEVGLEVSQESRSDHEAVLHFLVSDTGIGIPEDKRAAIFEMFEQVDTSTTRRHGGTGLGLAIAARLLALMDGRIWLESEVGRGSRFHFSVRLGLVADPPPGHLAAVRACMHGVRALVVDDNATNRRILQETLQGWQMCPATASSACEALDLLRRAGEADQPYQLVITDTHMPHTDGFMLAEQLQQDAAIGSPIIMMLTSEDRPDDAARCRRLGIAAHVLKPVKPSELLEAIELALGSAAGKVRLVVPPERQSHRTPRLRILVAEDSLVNQKLAVALLEGEGHTVAVAGNGKAAVAAAAAREFDLVLMDVQMPEMDGLEATALIRASERQTGVHVPIIAMTAHALKGDRERCLEAGMDNYVAKPIRPDELFETIAAVLAGQKASGRQ